jgi:hypothetical protein
MATFHPPFGGVKAGGHRLRVSFLGWHDVGECNITVNDDFHFAATGRYDALGHKGTFDLRLTLTDQNATSSSGPCTVSSAGQTYNGTYSKSGSAITLSDGHHSLTASPDGTNVLLQVAGYPKARIVA